MKKVLLVEDQQRLADLFSSLLRMHDYEVLLARDGEQALQMALQGPDVMVLDVVLPKLDGLAVLERLAGMKLAKPLPVIVFSNLEQEVLIGKALAMGAVDFVVKSDAATGDLIEKVNKYSAKTKLI